MKTPDAVRKQNRAALALMLAALLLVGVFMSLPAYRFSAGVYTLKSANTFVGDEKYQQALEEVNAVAEEYREKGFDVSLEESVTERTNSKGEKTSLVAFTLNNSFTKNGWSFLGAGLNSSWVLLAMLLCLLLALACALAGSVSTVSEPYKALDGQGGRFPFGGLLASAGSAAAPSCFLHDEHLHPVPACAALHRRRAHRGQGGVLCPTGRLSLRRYCRGGNKRSPEGAALQRRGRHVALPALYFRHASGGDPAPAWLCGPFPAPWYAVCLRYCPLPFYSLPYYVMLVTAFRSSAETNDMYFLHIFPTEWKFSNLRDIISRGVPRYLLNSFLIAGGATLIALLCGIPAAYAMARMKFKGKKLFLGFVIMSQMFSPVVLLIGISQLMSALHLNDSILGLMLINAAFNQAFAIWLLRGTFVSISPEMEQAARIDGCTTMGSLLHILLPMAAPGIVTTLIFVFINSWNEYTISTVLISTAANRPITVGITQFSSFNMIEWQYLFAASLLATVPVDHPVHVHRKAPDLRPHLRRCQGLIGSEPTPTKKSGWVKEQEKRRLLWNRSLRI